MVNVVGKSTSLVLVASSFSNSLPHQKSASELQKYFPQFNKFDALMVQSCALNARDKERRIRNEHTSSIFPSTSARANTMEHTKILSSKITSIDNTARYLNEIPLMQTK